MDDEALVTKFVLCGGVIWDSCATSPAHRWYAIAPGNDENSFGPNEHGDTPLKAVRKYIKLYGAPWEPKS